MPFVAGFVTAADSVIAEGAAFALGESREHRAFKILHDHWENSIQQDFKTMLLLPIALTRCDEAFDFLLDVVRFEFRDYATAAVKALKVYADHSHQRQQIRQAVGSRNDRYISEIYAGEFASEKETLS